MRIKLAGYSDIGGRPNQQDSFGVIPSANPKGPHLAVVLDGAGGHNNGAQASKFALKQVTQMAKDIRSGMTPDEVLEALGSMVAQAHDNITKNVQVNCGSKGMASTIVLACVLDGNAHIVWAGDSRAYLFRDGNLHCLTSDHSQVQEFVLRGMLTNAQARLHPQKNLITRALGCGNSKPDGISLSLRDGDNLLLVSDGIMDALDDHQIAEALTDGDSDKAEAIVRAAVKAKTSDNATAVWYEHITNPEQPVSRFYPLQVARLSTADTESHTPAGQIEVIDSLNNREVHQFNGTPSLKIGRGRTNAISIPDDPYLNHEHLKIEKDGDEYLLTDLNSRNGCYLKLTTEPTKVSAPFELIVGSHLVRITADSKGGDHEA